MNLGSVIKSLFEPKKSHSDSQLITEQYQVVGTHYYSESIKNLACANPDWKCTIDQLRASKKAGGRIFRYNYIHKPVKLIPENHPEDKNAVMVMIAGEKVGYISRENNVHVRNILKKKDIKYISAFISGGQYKTITQDDKFTKNEKEISITIKIAYT